ncbi:MAG: helix-turn-helix transcriptional regulator [Flavobacteriaceae bacterium]|nr:helix-turn-helix transcriptional regulator [Flavobacteriaceae bacterium]
MSINNIKNRLREFSKKDNSWIERAKYRKENKAWLDISFAIAVKVMSSLKSNKAANVFPKTQKELAKALDCSPQYVNKLLKGSEKLNIETISKIQKALNIIIIDIGLKKKNVEMVAQQEVIFNKKKVIIIKNYKKLDNVIQCNFTTNREHSQINEYRKVING